MPRGVRDSSLAARRRLITIRVLLRAMRKGWRVDKLADVLLASLTPSRVQAGVVGPCFYCGDDLASTVDHLVPVTKGGTDDRSNLVSCCLPCNNLKFNNDVRWFMRVYPFGADREKHKAWRKSLLEVIEDVA